MMDNVDVATMGLKKGEAELRDLERLWKYLAWQERDEVLRYASTFTHLDPLSPMGLPEERLRAVEEKIRELDARNAADRPSGGEAGEGPGMGLNDCMYRVTSLSDEGLVDLGKALGIANMEALGGSRYRLLAMFMMMGRNSTRAMFYAFRNILAAGGVA